MDGLVEILYRLAEPVAHGLNGQHYATGPSLTVAAIGEDFHKSRSADPQLIQCSYNMLGCRHPYLLYLLMPAHELEP